MESHVATFVVEGAFLTETARDLMLSERPAAAWRLLAENLLGGEPGQADMVARQVLDGTKKLTGDSRVGVGVSDDGPSDPETARYLKDVAYIYAGRFRIGDAWYRPAAEVVMYGEDDGHFAASRVDEALTASSPPRAIGKFWRDRVLYYAAEGQQVVEVQRSNGRRDFIICSPCGERPFWWKEPTRSATEALKEFFAAGRRLTAFEAQAPLSDDARCMPTGEATARVVPVVDEDDEDEREAEREREWKRRCQEIGDAVRERAGSDTFELVTEKGLRFTVPRAPFWHWALGRTTLGHMAPSWEPISPPGMKLMMDNPYHTDWMLGAGMDINTYYNDDDVKHASWDKAAEIQRDLGNFEAAVIVGGRTVRGEVGKNILVLRDLHPDHLPEAMKAEAIVTEQGGALAHLAQVALERGLVIMRVPDARKRLPPGTKLTLVPNEGTIEINYVRGA